MCTCTMRSNDIGSPCMYVYLVELEVEGAVIVQLEYGVECKL